MILNRQMHDHDPRRLVDTSELSCRPSLYNPHVVNMCSTFGQCCMFTMVSKETEKSLHTSIKSYTAHPLSVQTPRSGRMFGCLTSPMAAAAESLSLAWPL